MKVAILGAYGVEGEDIRRYLAEHQPHIQLTLLDQKTDPAYLSHLEEFDLIYKTPGVLFNLPEIQRAIRKGVKIVNIIDLFFEKARGTIIGVTGTKGKGTTTQLIYEILKANGEDVYLGGNIGNPPLAFVDQLTDRSITVLELSNVQLWGIRHSPHVAGVLGIFPDHLDWHKNFKEYVGTKYGIVKHQVPENFVFFFPDDKYSKQVAGKGKGRKVAVDPKDLRIELQIPGPHNRRNAAMAAAICAHVGVKPDIIIETIKNYQGLPYRLAKVTVKGSITYYNDSASTNPQTSAVAVKSFSGQSKVLIAGGSDKGLDYKPLKEALKDEQVKLVVLYGANRKKLKQALGEVAPLKLIVGSLEDAVNAAAKALPKGGVVIFSPGSASFDMFNNYKERGKAFDVIVKKLKG
ncbi:MAG: UDP-N-acetylmuramoyl-L-alanine--D-glutamate ligase [Patescibacteria group bacterium]|nr:UDP-N-acetylmuramoyl-L-alanine--D-glutamate ligase [Patescibacteria group bacterium]